MKMEHSICADAPGSIAALFVRPGDRVETGMVLLQINSESAEDQDS
jgi:biotin carboxyl carrier protein